VFLGQQHKVQCSENEMKVLVGLPDNNTRVYLEGLNGYKSDKCEPKINDNLAIFELNLINYYDCGLTRVVNKLTVSTENKLISCRFSAAIKLNHTHTHSNASSFFFITSHQDIKTFYHKVIIESGKLKQIVSVKCITQRVNLDSTVYQTHSIVRRDVLPAGFKEDE
jgi:hypothetical protein